MRWGWFAVVVGIACRDQREPPPPPSPLEASIATALVRRYGVPLAVTCQREQHACTAHAPGIALPIKITDEGSALDWHVDGLVVRAAAIEDYIRAELVELGSAQAVRCGARLWHVKAGDRNACELERGGTVFVTVAEDGTTSYEIHLDSQGGQARAESVSDAREHELLEMSRQLDEDVPPLVDAGAAITDDPE